MKLNETECKIYGYNTLFEQLKSLSFKYHENSFRGSHAVRVHVLMD